MPERLHHRQLIITCFAQIAKGGGMEKLAGTQAKARGPSYCSMAPVEPTIHFIQLRLAAGEGRLCDRARQDPAVNCGEEELDMGRRGPEMHRLPARLR